MRDSRNNTSVDARSRSRSTSSSSQSQKSGSRTSSGSGESRATSEPHHSMFEDRQMDDEQWSRLAFTLGMPYGGEKRPPSQEAIQFAQHVRSRRSVYGTDMTNLLLPLLVSAAKTHKTMKCRANPPFHRDGVSDDVTPQPAITLGYSRRTFTPHQLGLQHGVISNHGEQYNLGKLSEPVSDVFWPFFVVEAQDNSMLAAQSACIRSAGTCQNALMIFAAAAQDPRQTSRDMNFLWSLSKAAQSFSLAISGKTACLNTHNSEGYLPHAVAVIKTYRLDNEKEVESMLGRIRSILVWAENCRLESIDKLLVQFDERVQLYNNAMARYEASQGPIALSIPGSVPKRRRSIIKSVLADSLPWWMRA